jgi:methionyl-tRNA synthetase
VWFDAPIGYIPSTKEWAYAKERTGEPNWEDQDTKLVHFIGKTLFFIAFSPAMLKAEGGYFMTTFLQMSS